MPPETSTEHLRENHMYSIRRPWLFMCLATACNQPPEGGVVDLEPANPSTSDELRLVFVEQAVDKKDDVSYAIEWFRNGEHQRQMDGQSAVPAGLTTRDDTWKVVVTPSDDDLDGASFSAETIVNNSAPTVSVGVGPKLPDTQSALTASATSEDADGDALDLAWSWTRNGVATDVTTNVVPALMTQKGDVWQVSVIASDDALSSEPATDSIDVANQRPRVLSVGLSPLVPNTASDIHANYTTQDV
ncbi:MAG: hypothetical protein ACI9MC_001874, partial [Kiritimatiellia bacterium]